ncbi:MAG: thiamine pyrophosphate-dependent dehydrogenase E1 component subunit alpha, partial [Planctomycetota bacterium]|nr:thiamine pyrophosphate-dependent dehydrogenase E1 component subunit alpha [Planctomycetota bacterium]
AADYERAFLLEIYRQMFLIRTFEDRVKLLFLEGSMPGTIHQCQGQEAAAVGVCSALNDDDFITSTHRPHGHALAKGLSPLEVLIELFGGGTGCCKGKGGSMHLFDRDINFLGGYAIVAGMCPIAVGVAKAVQHRGEDRVVLCFFGDGATNQGVYHEALNMSALYNLPLIWVCENNHYAIGTSVQRASGEEDLAKKARAYDMPVSRVDGMDFFKMQSVTQRAINRARAGKGPSYIVANCYRYRGHSMSDPGTVYRSKEEIDFWKKRDPLPRLKALIQEDFEAGEEEFKEIDEKVTQLLREAVRFAEQGEELPREKLYEDLYAD